MEYLQYPNMEDVTEIAKECFKPCYKWNTFNTSIGLCVLSNCPTVVLNLVINGIPSIHRTVHSIIQKSYCFKPCYKWNTFNTLNAGYIDKGEYVVLNLVINGIPSILDKDVLKVNEVNTLF